VQWLPDDTYIAPDHIRYWADPIIWPTWNGKVTLAGDAAHPMMPFRAQGLNNALQDAHSYVVGLISVVESQKTLSEVVTEYSHESLRRGAAEIKLSSAWGPTLHDWNTLVNTPMMKQGYGKRLLSR
jgi:2-polyprenyl-6-methoxyphenol hydroxylase-like FAD-dependent oxidoreductase